MSADILYNEVQVKNMFLDVRMFWSLFGMILLTAFKMYSFSHIIKSISFHRDAKLFIVHFQYKVYKVNACKGGRCSCARLAYLQNE
jgi:hypothetical protein